MVEEDVTMNNVILLQHKKPHENIRQKYTQRSGIISTRILNDEEWTKS